VQERVVQQGRLLIGLGPNDEERWRRDPWEASAERAWVECGRVTIDEAWGALGATALEWPQVLHAIQRHLTALVAGGWGNPIGELLDCWVDPAEEQLFLCDQIYEVVRDYGELTGLVGQYCALTEAVTEDATVLELHFLSMPDTTVQIAGMDWMRTMLLATHPVVGCRLPARDMEDDEAV